ncbi:MAG: hypothetical protein RBT67_12460 [Thauera sp.]|nr:hypothetical protein [Thauera sp.]
MVGEISNSIRMGHAAIFNGLDDTGLDQLKTGRVAMPRKKNDDGPSTHSEKLKVEYDQVMYAIHRSAKRFCAPGIHSGVPELAVLLDRNFNTLESQLNPTNYDHAPTVHCFLQVVEALKSREAVEEIARLAGCHTLPVAPKARAVGAPDDLAEALRALPAVASIGLRATVARLEGGRPLSAAQRAEAREALFDLAAYVAHLIHRIRLP